MGKTCIIVGQWKYDENTNAKYGKVKEIKRKATEKVEEQCQRIIRRNWSLLGSGI